jgi:hypothetical protein
MKKLSGLCEDLLFSATFMLLLVQAVRAIRRSVRQSLASPVMAVSIGLLVSAVVLLAVYMLRVGSLYQPSFWMLFGLISAIPQVFRAKARRVARWPTHQELR